MSHVPRWLCGAIPALVLAACGGAPAASPAASSAPASASSAASKPSAPASAKPAAASGSVSAKPVASAASKPAVASGPIKIGMLLPRTGGLANLGTDNLDAFNLYMDTINHTVAGRKVDVTVGDTAGQADVGLNKAKQLVENDKVSALMGLTATPVGYAVAGYVKDAHVPLMITENSGAQSLTSDPKFKSPYLTRFTQNATIVLDPAADWAYKHGWRKAILLCSDYGAGLENAATFASSFIRLGGSIVQELYPPVGTTDFGPYLTQLKQGADFVLAFFPGVDGLRAMQQYGNYGQKQYPLLDSFGAMTTGSNLPDLQDKAVGVIGEQVWSQAADSPENKAFLKVWEAKYPGRYPSTDAAMGYSAAQILESALNTVKGNVEDTQAFLNALYGINVKTAKGPMKLDADHDIVENLYVYQMEKQAGRYDQKLLDTYTGVSKSWIRSPDELAHFPFGKLKGKLVGMTKDQVDQLAKG